MHDVMTVDTPLEFEVIGEHLFDPTQLLVIGEDGHFYALDLRDGHCEPTKLTEYWVVDTCDLGDKLGRAKLN
jgi:hypothetical protein